MISAFSSLILVPESGPERVLTRVPLSGASSSATYSERWLQDLVYLHPAALPVAEIDRSFSSMVPVCQEMPTPVGPIDVVYVTRDGRPVIVEAKLWRNPEARRKVVGQILDYAKELSRWTFEDFDAAVRRARHREDRGAAKGVLEVMGAAANTPEAAQLHDAITQSLRRGDLLLLIVGDGIREGVGAIAEFIEGQGSLHFTFGLVEMAIYELPDGRGRVVQPRVLAQSTIVRRTIVELRHESLNVRDSAAEDGSDAADEEANPELVENRRRFQTFWKGFLEKLRLDDGRQNVAEPARAANQYFTLPKETRSWVSAFVAESQHRAGVHLTFYKGPIADRLYAALHEERAAIERELGVPVSWESNAGKHMISSSESFPSGFVEKDPEPVQRLLAQWTNRYINVFRPRLEKLAREAM
jgi:hypothetical protein